VNNRMITAGELTAQIHLEGVAGEVVYENAHHYDLGRQRTPRAFISGLHPTSQVLNFEASGSTPRGRVARHPPFVPVPPPTMEVRPVNASRSSLAGGWLRWLRRRSRKV
jgi:hypothetical protein